MRTGTETKSPGSPSIPSIRAAWDIQFLHREYCVHLPHDWTISRLSLIHSVLHGGCSRGTLREDHAEKPLKQSLKCFSKSSLILFFTYIYTSVPAKTTQVPLVQRFLKVPSIFCRQVFFFRKARATLNTILEV